MTAFWIPTIVLIAVVGALVVNSIVRVVFKRYPRVRTSAKDRLIALNPTLNEVGTRWSISAERIRIGWITKVVVATAIIVAASRPRTVVAN